MEELNYDERSICMKQLVQSLAWKKYLLPWLKKQRERHKNILNIRTKNNEDDIKLLDKLKDNKTKCQVYSNLIRLPDTWIDQGNFYGDKNAKKT